MLLNRTMSGFYGAVSVTDIDVGDHHRGFYGVKASMSDENDNYPHLYLVFDREIPKPLAHYKADFENEDLSKRTFPNEEAWLEKIDEEHNMMKRMLFRNWDSEIIGCPKPASVNDFKVVFDSFYTVELLFQLVHKGEFPTSKDGLDLNVL